MLNFESLLIPAFLAGLVSFLAPCTLPLVPGFIGFISGSSVHTTTAEDQSKDMRRRILVNAALYVLGFGLVFVLLGVLFGLLGSVLSPYRVILSRVGGVFIVLFGLYLIPAFEGKFFSFLAKEKRLPYMSKLEPGTPLSSLIFGMTFAFGWTPCVGPILGSILLLASTQGTVVAGAVLLGVFALGLAVPYMVLAFFIGHAASVIRRLTQKMYVISLFGGVLLIILGVLLILDRNDLFIGFFYRLFEFLDYERLLIDVL